MIDRNEIEGEVLGAIDAAFNAEWWDHICEETQEDIRDKLAAVWDVFFPKQQNSESKEPAAQSGEAPVQHSKPKMPRSCEKCFASPVCITERGSSNCKEALARHFGRC